MKTMEDALEDALVELLEPQLSTRKIAGMVASRLRNELRPPDKINRRIVLPFELVFNMDTKECTILLNRMCIHDKYKEQND